MNEWIKTPPVKILKEEPKKDFEKSGREIIGISNDFAVSFEDFNSNTTLKSKEEIVQRLCLSLEIFFKDRNSKEDPFLDIRLICDVDITFFNFLLSIAKIASAYDLPKTYRAIEKHLRSFASGFDNKNYLMYSLPKHFVGILEGTTKQEYEHSLYTKFDSNTFITMKNDGILYTSKSKERDHIIKNWEDSHLLERIEIHNEKDKETLDSIAPKMNEIRNELNNIYSSEYSPEGTFIGLKFPNENELIAHTNMLKRVLEKFDGFGDEIIKKNNPDIDSRFAKADDLHRENDSFFDKKFNFDVFKEKLLGLNLDAKSLYNNYLTFWSEPDIRKFLEEDLGFHFEQHNFQQQVYFLDYLKDISIKESKKIKEFSGKYGVDGFNSFLSIAYGGKGMGDKILELGDSEKFPEDIARKVFAKYGEIIDTADNIEMILKDLLPEEIINESSKEINQIKESLLVRAKDLLSTFYEKKERNNTELLNDLDRYKAEILLYADTYKKLKESGKDVTLEDIKNTQITILSQEEKEKMAKNFWNINKANRPFIKEGSQEMTNREKNFNLTIENTASDFYVLKHKEEVVAFCSFTPDENGDLYLESVNIEAEAKGSHIGSEFLPIVLEKVKKLDKNIYGHVNAFNSMALPYYERLGFDIREIKENGELKYYEIRIPAQQQQVSNIAA